MVAIAPVRSFVFLRQAVITQIAGMACSCQEGQARIGFRRQYFCPECQG